MTQGEKQMFINFNQKLLKICYEMHKNWIAFTVAGECIEGTYKATTFLPYPYYTQYLWPGAEKQQLSSTNNVQ